eukprot:scaffold42124_cov298-Isochrysis_galbana.AAC.1
MASDPAPKRWTAPQGEERMRGSVRAGGDVDSAVVPLVHEATEPALPSPVQAFQIAILWALGALLKAEQRDMCGGHKLAQLGECLDHPGTGVPGLAELHVPQPCRDKNGVWTSARIHHQALHAAEERGEVLPRVERMPQ